MSAAREPRVDRGVSDPMRWSWIVGVAVVGGLVLTSLPAARACPWPEAPPPCLVLGGTESPPTPTPYLTEGCQPFDFGVRNGALLAALPDDPWTSAIVVERTTDGWVWYSVDPAGHGVPFRLYGRWEHESSAAEPHGPNLAPAVAATLCGLALAAVVAILRRRRRTAAVVP